MVAPRCCAPLSDGEIGRKESRKKSNEIALATECILRTLTTFLNLLSSEINIYIHALYYLEMCPNLVPWFHSGFGLLNVMTVTRELEI